MDGGFPRRDLAAAIVRPRHWLMLIAALFTAACAAPAARLQQSAAEAGLRVRSVDVAGMPLLSFERGVAGPAPVLHVYLDSDGTPWERGLWPARDPTPRRSLALALMRIDPAPSVYLNRPCYGQVPMPPGCTSSWWTDARYSAAVVEAMSRALDRIRARYGSGRLVLIGHSGGGTLAMLLAGRRQDVAAVVTVGANLDHASWTRHFGYEPLGKSLNVAAQPPLPPGVLRWHLVGEADAVVPPAVTAAGAAGDPHQWLRRYAGFGHHCCWEGIWGKLLGELEAALRADSGD